MKRVALSHSAQNIRFWKNRISCDNRTSKARLKYQSSSSVDGQEELKIYFQLSLIDGITLERKKCALFYPPVLSSIERSHPLFFVFSYAQKLQQHESWEFSGPCYAHYIKM